MHLKSLRKCLKFRSILYFIKNAKTDLVIIIFFLRNYSTSEISKIERLKYDRFHYLFGMWTLIVAVSRMWPCSSVAVASRNLWSSLRQQLTYSTELCCSGASQSPPSPPSPRPRALASTYGGVYTLQGDRFFSCITNHSHKLKKSYACTLFKILVPFTYF